MIYLLIAGLVFDVLLFLMVLGISSAQQITAKAVVTLASTIIDTPEYRTFVHNFYTPPDEGSARFTQGGDDGGSR